MAPSLLVTENKELCDSYNTTTTSNTPSSLFCPIYFDGLACWNRTDVDDAAISRCPFVTCPECDVTDVYATRECLSTGWARKPNWTSCVRFAHQHQECVTLGCNMCKDMFRDFVIGTSLFLSVVSIILLIISLVLFLSFKSLRCRRLTIHINLASAFILRFFFFTLWTFSQLYYVFWNCEGIPRKPLMHLDILCKWLLYMVMYGQVSSITWMFVEGAYLISRFTVFALRRNEGPIAAYLTVGWVIPVIPTTIWAIVHEKVTQRKGAFCWLPFTKGDTIYIIFVYMAFAIVLNLIFLLVIVVLLVQKLRAANTAESRKIWKTVKATLLLVPLLGLAHVPLFWEPDDPDHLYMYASAVLQNSQGIFIAILYCFCNMEVRNAVRREWKSYRGMRFKTTLETEATTNGKGLITTADSSISSKRRANCRQPKSGRFRWSSAGSSPSFLRRTTPHFPLTEKTTSNAGGERWPTNHRMIIATIGNKAATSRVDEDSRYHCLMLSMPTSGGEPPMSSPPCSADTEKTSLLTKLDLTDVAGGSRKTIWSDDERDSPLAPLATAREIFDLTDDQL